MPDPDLPEAAWLEAGAAYRSWRIGDDGEGRLHAALVRAAPLIRADERERDAKDRTAAEANITRLGIHVDRLGKEHGRHSLAVSAHKARADQQESRAVHAEKQLARFLDHAQEYDRLAEQAAMSRRNADLVTELRRRVTALEKSSDRARAAERERIAQIADLVGAVYDDDGDGVPEPFADLIRGTPPQESHGGG